MPPKLTSKNIFDVVFAQLPADAFIDTGPASLREELTLEAAGISSSGSSGMDHNTTSRGGSSHFRRHLLPTNFLTAAAGGISSSSDGGTRKSNAGRSAGTSSAAAGREEEDVLGEGEEPVDGDGTTTGAPPAYASAANTTGLPSKSSLGGGSTSLFRRVDDDVYGSTGGGGGGVTGSRALGGPRTATVRGAGLEASGAGKTDAVEKLSGQKRGEDAQGTEDAMNFSLQLDAEDDAVKEATKYAKYVAAIQADAANNNNNNDGGNTKMFNEDGTGQEGISASGTSLPGDSAHAGTAAGTGQSRTAQLHAATHSTPNAGADTGAVQGPSSTSISGPSSTAEGRHAPNASSAPDHGAPAGQSSMNRRGPLTAAEQLALMPPGMDRIYTGRCVTYRHPKGFGFISPDLGGPDVYFINDGIGLSFTRLALRAFYLQHGMPVTASAAAAFHAARPAEATTAAAVREEEVVVEGKGEAVDRGEQTTAQDANSQDAAAEQTVEKGAEASTEERTAESQLQSETAPTASTTEGLSTIPIGGTEGDQSTPQPATTAGVLGAAETPSFILSSAAGVDIGDLVSIPPTTAEELAHAETAAAMLSPATAQLLQYQIDQGFTGGLRVGERLSFVVTRNHAGRGGNGRLLRAEFVRGPPSAAYAMPVEQSWFAPMFPDAVGRKANTHGGMASAYAASAHHEGDNTASSAAAPSSSTAGEGSVSTLVRYTGCVRTYVAEDQRGYLCCDETNPSGGNTPDVVFYAHSFLWDAARCPPMKRQIKEGMRVAYSVCGTERNGKYVATLITNVDGQPLCDENTTFAEHVMPYFMAEGSRRRGRDDNSGGNASGGGVSGNGRAGNSAEGILMNSGADVSGGGGGVGANGGGGGGGANGGGGGGVGGERKRAKVADEDLLFFEEDEYPFL